MREDVINVFSVKVMEVISKIKYVYSQEGSIANKIYRVQFGEYISTLNNVVTNTANNKKYKNYNIAEQWKI